MSLIPVLFKDQLYFFALVFIDAFLLIKGIKNISFIKRKCDGLVVRNMSRIFPFLLVHCKTLDILCDFPIAPYLYQFQGQRLKLCFIFPLLFGDEV